MTLLKETLSSRFIRLLVEQDEGASKLTVNQALSILQDLEALTDELGASGGSGFNSSVWRSDVDDQAAPPKNKRLEWNHVTQNSATELFISINNDNGADVSALFALLGAGDHIRIQLKTDSSISQVFEITSIVDNGDYWTFGVDNTSSGGGNISNNREIIVTFISASDVPDHATSHENGGGDEINVGGLSGELADAQPPKTHSATHTNGADDIQNATASQKGLATSTQITKLNGIATAATADAKATQGEVNTGTDADKFVTSLTLQNKTGIVAFFLDAQGLFGTGGGWADSGFINLVPHLLFASNLTERAVYMFYALARIKFDSIDPQVAFLTSSTSAPSAAEAVRWQLTCRYRAEGEDLGGTADETLLQTQALTALTANSRQSVLIFTLDRTLISDQDSIHFNLERLGGDGADTYGADIGVGQSGFLVETINHNP